MAETSEQDGMADSEVARRDYSGAPLRRAEMSADPLVQFGAWYEEARRAPGIVEPNAMQLATVSGSGKPSVRTVLLKSHGVGGFVFYTNMASAKASDLSECPYASVVFWWEVLSRQIRISGEVGQVSAVESDAYFASRPRASQLGAWASLQSRVIASRPALEASYSDCARRFAGQAVGRPPYWGGYRMVPERFEFWQGQSDRAHDRLRYVRSEDGSGWHIERLAP